eukprot:m51a1_g9176 scaffold protein NifU (329) ;mRNA; f:47302-48689
MGKNSLISGALWEQYSRKVTQRMNNPQHRGEITDADAEAIGCSLLVADWGAEACGDAVRLFWAVEKGSDIIRQAKFLSFGCGTAIASSDMMCELCLGKKVDEVLAINNLVVEAALRDEPDHPAVPPQKMHCSVMAHDVLKLAVSVWRGVSVESLEDREIVCQCARVTRGTIREAIRLNDLKTVEQVTQYTKAGGFCKSCIRPGGHEKRDVYIEDILKETRAEMEREKRKAAAAAGVPGFKTMSFVRKGNIVQNVIDRDIQPMLQKDGGSCDVIDVRDEGEATIVEIQYGGACVGCSSAHSGTLFKIQEALREAIDPSIVVKVVEGETL